MTISWNAAAQIGITLCCLGALVPAPVAADPIRLTVQFTVSGADGTTDTVRDPDFGDASVHGFFSVVTEVPVGDGFRSVTKGPDGLNADQVSLSFANTSWTPNNADILFLIFFQGQLTHWVLGGVPSGINGVTGEAGPDILVDSIVNQDDLSFFAYTTPRTAELGIFGGRASTTNVTMIPVAATPEPTSLLLWTTGIVVVRATRKRAARLS